MSEYLTEDAKVRVMSMTGEGFVYIQTKSGVSSTFCPNITCAGCGGIWPNRQAIARVRELPVSVLPCGIDGGVLKEIYRRSG